MSDNQKKLKFAIVGTGNRGVLCFGKMLVKRDDCEIVALVDPNHVRSAAAAEMLDIKPAFFKSISDMLKEIKPDAVIITSPDYTHCENAIIALDGGCNVLLDKPLATHVSDCRNIIAAADRSSKILMMGFNLRHHPVLKKLKSLLDQGVAGKVFMIENREFYHGGRTYMARWNGDYAKSGGLWIHKGSHDFDVFQWLMDFPKPVRVSSFSGLNVLDEQHLPFKLRPGVEAGPNCRRCAYAKECPDIYDCRESKLFGEDAIAVDGYYKDNCIYVSPKSVHDNGMSIVEYDNGAKAVHSECFIGPINDRKYTIWGDRATIEVSLTNREITVYPRWSQDTVTHKIAPDDGGGHGGADPLLLEAFVNALKNGEASSSTAEHGMWSTACGEAAELSWREHRMVEIAELFK
ncbi:MAG: Gfo/Idh/MocA family oxidoreductase [Lentisphaeria bacterium]|nr:Gfo/Idh/MocA family oxidoreductase [Lentisphaeria bacterium]